MIHEKAEANKQIQEKIKGQTVGRSSVSEYRKEKENEIDKNILFFIEIVK